MVFFETLRDFLRLLDNRSRAYAALLVALLAISGALEIVALFFLFGYISVLGGAEIRTGASIVTDIYTTFAGGFEGAAFALVAGLVLVAIFAAKNLVWLASSFALLRFSMKRYQRVAAALFEGYQDMPLELIRQRGTEKPTQVLSSVLMVFRTGFTPLVQAAADIAVIIAMMVALLLAIDVSLVIGSGVVLGATVVGFLVLTRRLSQELGERSFTAQRHLQAVTTEALRGIVDVRLAGRQDVMQQRFENVASEFALAERRVRAIDMTPRVINELILAAGIALAASWFAASGDGLAAALPALAVLGFAGLRITSAAARLMQSLQMMRHSSAARRQMMGAIEHACPELLSRTAHVAYSRETYRPVDHPLPSGVSSTPTKAIELRDLTFRYPGAELAAVDHVNLRIDAGSFTAFCGPSGGGKSTLTLLLMGLLKPQAGQVLCDDWNVHEHLTTWHGEIGYVGQAPYFAPRSARENVALGIPPELIDDAAVWRALEAAAVADVFRQHPEGLEAKVGEDGGLLSGGQRQRIAIARALYNNPGVLVFDEATAALDTVTEREVSRAIASLRGDRTVIAVAHRLSTIERADMIHVVSGGRIEASGTHAELLDRSATFRTLAGEQV